MLSELSAVWEGPLKEDGTDTHGGGHVPPVSAKLTAVEEEQVGSPSHEAELLHEIILLRKQAQKRDMVFCMGALIGFSLLVSHIDRLHSRIRSLERHGR